MAGRVFHGRMGAEPRRHVDGKASDRAGERDWHARDIAAQGPARDAGLHSHRLPPQSDQRPPLQPENQLRRAGKRRSLPSKVLRKGTAGRIFPKHGHGREFHKGVEVEGRMFIRLYP